MEARWMVEEAGVQRWPAVLDLPVSDPAGVWFDQMVERRRRGEPLQYVLGHWPFRTLDLIVDRRVLIPRPETETVVEVALGELDSLAEGGLPPLVAVDLGTGSGAIGLSLAAERYHVEVWATDRCEAALEVARANLAGAGRAAARVQFRLGWWWDALPPELVGRVALAVVNPPYISVGEMGGLDPVVAHWEPESALLSGPDGLEDVRQVLDGAGRWLAPAASLVVEIAPHQSHRAVGAAADAGFGSAEVRPDLAGRPRALVVRRR